MLGVTKMPARCRNVVPTSSPTSAAILCSLIAACAGPQAPSREASVSDDLATRLVAWDMVRRRAESNLLTIPLTIPLPSIAVRKSVIGDDGIPQVTIVAIPRLAPHFAAVSMAWPTICERRGVLPDDVFNYAMAWCRYVRDGKGDLEQARRVQVVSCARAPGGGYRRPGERRR